ncbi:MAG: 3-phosphoshikimate 1-carboxyvinyltransferase [Acidobacteriota bacterium]|nr:3-phosphoshikimate 1-carboxyvinyltransferase [Acidobacteriota bacterium]
MTDSTSSSLETGGEAAPPSLVVPGPVTVTGTVTPPPSKSLSHRSFNLALLAGFGTAGAPLTVRRPLLAQDTRLFLAALETCGFEVELDEGGDAEAVDAEGGDPGAAVRLTPGEPPASGEIFCGNAGTMFRFLTATLCALPGRWRLDGTERLRERPVGPLLAALRGLGAHIHCPAGDGFAPLEIEGGSLQGGTTTLDAGESSQYLSAVLQAALRAPAPVTVEVTAMTSAPYLDLTLDMVKTFGGRVSRPEAQVYRVEPGLRAPQQLTVEADFSAACYPAAAAALCAGGSGVTVAGLDRDSRQGDRGLFDLLEQLGAAVRWERSGDESVAVVGRGQLMGRTVDMSAMPDQVPTLAALAPFCRGVTRIENVPHLRIKESDRLLAMATELRKLGVPVEELDDGLVIPGVWADGVPADLSTDRPTVAVDTWDDHRIAMSLALVGLRRGGVEIRHPEVVGKSYPGFWNDLETLVQG